MAETSTNHTIFHIVTCEKIRSINDINLVVSKIQQFRFCSDGLFCSETSTFKSIMIQKPHTVEIIFI